MMKEYVQLEKYPEYEIDEEGHVRKILTKKYKSIYRDTRGRGIVVLPSTEGPMICEYVFELLNKTFGIPISDEDKLGDCQSFERYKKEKEEEISALKQSIEARDELLRDTENELNSLKGSLNKPVKKKKKCILCTDLNLLFTSVSKAAKYFGFNYDKFYNSFYTQNKNEIFFEGHTFRLEEK